MAVGTASNFEPTSQVLVRGGGDVQFEAKGTAHRHKGTRSQSGLYYYR